MGEKSKIEWTHHTFNPWIGCTKVSPGCDHCYAEGVAARFKMAQWGAGKPRRLAHDDYWKQPLAWNRKAQAQGIRQRVFCASLADVFDNEVPDAWRYRLWDLIAATPSLDWLLLTKRIGNVKMMMPARWLDYPLPNVWLGASIINQAEADRDIPKLLATPARVRFLSMEPLLERVDITNYLMCLCGKCGGDVPLDWVIVGGESGPGARAMHPDWVREIREQCIAASVSFFFKQWGEWQPLSTGDGKQILPFGKYVLPTDDSKGFGFLKKGKKSAGRLLDGVEWNQYPKEIAV